MPTTRPAPIAYDRRQAQAVIDRVSKSSDAGDRFREGLASPADRRTLARAVARSTAARIGRITEAWAEEVEGERITKALLAEWSSRVRREIVASRLAGARIMTDRPPADEDREALDALIREQFDYLDNFIRDIRDGDVEPGAAMVARARMYGASAWADAMNFARATRLRSKGRARRRTSPEVENCSDCVEIESLGWQPLEKLPPIGKNLQGKSSKCMAHCHCYFEFEDERQEVSKHYEMKFNPNHDERGRFSSGDGEKRELSEEEVGEILANQHYNREAGRSAISLRSRWLVSERFVKTRIPIDAATPAGPATGESRSTGPIIVDRNSNSAGIGRFEANPPKVIVVDGKHRLAAAKARGETHIDAYVGTEALEHIKESKSGPSWSIKGVFRKSGTEMDIVALTDELAFLVERDVCVGPVAMSSLAHVPMEPAELTRELWGRIKSKLIEVIKA